MMVDRVIEKVDIHLRATNLPKLHTFNVTDPYASFSLLDKRDGASLVQFGATEYIQDSLNPSFAQSATVDYLFEEVQTIVVQVFHAASGKHELIGEARFPLTALMLAREQNLTLALSNPARHGVTLGEIHLHGEAQVNTRDVFNVAFFAEKLTNKDGFFGKSDPFYDLSRLNEDGSWTLVFTSKHVDNSLSPRWNAVKIPLVSLCNGDLDRPLRVRIWDYDSDGKHDSMGETQTSVRQLLESSSLSLPVIEADKKAKKRGYVDSGTLHASDVRIEPHPTFAQFIAGGCEINLVVAIDFTGSNGDPREATSLHYLDPAGHAINVYQQAISAVGHVLEPYDSDKQYSVFGYGARVLQADGSLTGVQHAFPIGNGTAGEAATGSTVSGGVPGLLTAYVQSLHHVAFSGPTLMAPIINATAALTLAAGCSQAKQKYTVLLIITDGAINDMEATKAAIAHASQDPLSIIIIGVGPDDFSEMVELDGDKRPIAGSQRDIVQFVAFKPGMGAQVVAQQVLAEIPKQLLEYMEKKNIRPNGGRR